MTLFHTKHLLLLIITLLATALYIQTTEAQQKQLQPASTVELTDITEENTLKTKFSYKIRNRSNVYYNIKALLVNDTNTRYENITREEIGGVTRTSREVGDKLTITRTEQGRTVIDQRRGSFMILKECTIGENTSISINSPIEIRALKKEVRKNTGLLIETIVERNDTVFFTFINIIPDTDSYRNQIDVVNSNDTDATIASTDTIIPFHTFFTTTLQNTALNLPSGTDNKTEFFILKKSADKGRLGYSCYVAGIVIVPFKIRPSHKGFNVDSIEAPSEVTTDINAGLYGGRRWGWGEYRDGKFKNNAFTVGLLLSPQKVAITKDNTRPDRLTQRTDYSTLGITSGLLGLFSIEKFNIGVVAGVDFATGKGAPRWYYQGLPWLGFAIGYKISLFK